MRRLVCSVLLVFSSLSSASFGLSRSDAAQARRVWVEIPELGAPAAHMEENDVLRIPASDAAIHVGYFLIHLNRGSAEIAGATLSVRVNAVVANGVMTQRNFEDGVVCNVALLQNPSIALRPGRNSVEVTFRDRWNKPHYASFLIQVATGRAAEPGRAGPVISAQRRYALVVGIAQYQAQGAGVNNLAYADSDARALREFLTSPRGGGYHGDDVVLLLNQDAVLEKLRSTLAQMIGRLGPKDLLVIYLNMHGGYDPSDPEHKYLLTYDSNPRSLRGTALPITELPETIAASGHARQVVVLADTCHSAEIGEGLSRITQSVNLVNQYLVEGLRTKGVSALEASDAGQLSLEGREWNDRGVFTHELIKGLGGEADRNHDGVVTASELFVYVRQAVLRDTMDRQMPLSDPNGAGNVALAGAAATRTGAARR